MATLDELAAAFAEDMAPQTAAEVAAQAGCLEAALALAGETRLVGLSLQRGQDARATAHGHLDATCSPAEIRRLFSERPGPMVGINTGAAGLVVLDNDVKNGVDGYETSAAFSHELGVDLTDTMLVDTPSGGQHGYFLAGPYRVGCDNRGKLVGPGVDVKGEGGYVIAPAPATVTAPTSSSTATASSACASYRLLSASAWPSPAARPRARQARDPGTPPTTPSPSPRAAATPLSPAWRQDATRWWNPAEIEAALLLVANAKRCRLLPEEEPQDRRQRGPTSPPGRFRRPQRCLRADEPSDESASVRTGVFIDWSTFWDRDHNEAEWVYPDVLARGRGHAIYAAHKAGKSLLMLCIAAELATGAEPVVVVYLDYEMTEADVFDRLEDMGYGPDSDLSRLRYALLPTLPPLDTARAPRRSQGCWTASRATGRTTTSRVVIDTISRAVRGEENNADTFRDFYSHTGTG